MKTKSKWKNKLLNIWLNIVGVFCYAIGLNCFVAPHKIAPGGASGIAVLVNYITGCPIGLFVFLFNIPLLGYILVKGYFSKTFVIKTLATTAFLSVVTDVLISTLPVYEGNPLLASMFGGALMGSGLAFVHLGYSNTGGISLLGLIVQKIMPQFQVGALIMVLNSGIVFASGIVYRNIESMLYAILTVYISGLFMDKILESARTKNLIIVVSECTDKVREIFLQTQKGITILKGEGGYTSEPQRVIMCAANRLDCENIQKSINQVDEKALVIVTEASRITGKGFKHMV